MPTIAVVNQKGGAGKSTVSVHLARWLQRRKEKILFIDADGQQTSSIWLESLENEIPFKVIQDPNELLEQLPKLTKTKQWVLIDGPATLSETTRAVLLWADLALIPCQPAGVDLASASDTVRLVRQAQLIRGGLPKSALFLNKAIKGTRLKEEAITVLKQIEDVTFLSSIIHQRQIITDSFGQGATVFELTGTSAGVARRELDSLFKQAMEVLDA
ncbi:MAG TPA: AAA family ATPase [Leptolyngbyaceae cyanobacterium M33_DOE_097]|uniref:ParA family protein n=1 Tax=Oscillatoriales cyanobacterium SpSt-418 TaxID=2282169 RepID=A0A7C3KJS1_9CYAN|nr:AAA family ATPase [Leptolyngbyaceae cyanobacterium M33_DOE_097]